jgi:hypothetical protein
MNRLLLTLLSITFAGCLMAQIEVYTPTLKSPADSAINQLPDVYLSWNAITGSLGLQYEVQLDTTTNFNSPLLIDTTQTLLTGYKTHELIFGMTYFWRVRAIDLGQTSYWSTVWSFTIFDQITLLKPGNSTTDNPPNTDIEWSNKIGNLIVITGVKYYDYQIDTTLNFNSPLLIEGTKDNKTFKASTINLYFGVTYYWRVRARHDLATSSWSTTWYFTVTNKITLSTPNDNATNQVLDVSLKWKNPGGFLAFEYQVALDPDFTNIVLASETDTTIVKADFLMFGNKYYWRVRGRHLLDTTSWGTARNFTTINTVILKSPANAATGVALKPTFQWTAQTGIASFELQVDLTPDFTNPVIQVSPAANAVNYVSSKKLNALTIYYWRMRAISDGTAIADTTNWSDSWTFTTASPTGLNENTNLMMSVFPNPAKEKVYVKVVTERALNTPVCLIDLIGKTAFSRDYSLIPGKNMLEIPLDGVSKGVYILRLDIGDEILHQKLIVE